MRLRNKKTGEHGEYQVVSAGYLIRVRNCDTNESYQYDSIAGFNDNWEDYKPTEPLIKDGKIRKAVRAWAEANGAWLLVVVSDYRIEISQVDAEILFNDPVFKELPRDRQLTVSELCGEEKTCES